MPAIIVRAEATTTYIVDVTTYIASVKDLIVTIEADIVDVLVHMHHFEPLFTSIEKIQSSLLLNINLKLTTKHYHYNFFT